MTRKGNHINNSNWEAISAQGDEAAIPLMKKYDSEDYSYNEKKKIVSLLSNIIQRDVGEFLVRKYIEIYNTIEKKPSSPCLEGMKELRTSIGVAIGPFGPFRGYTQHAALEAIESGCRYGTIIGILGIKGNTEAIDTLTSLISAGDYQVAQQAIESLGHIRTKGTENYLLKILLDQNRYPVDWRYAAVRALSRHKPEDSVRKISDAFLDLVKAGPYSGDYSPEATNVSSQERNVFMETEIINKAIFSLSFIGDNRVIEPAIRLFNVPDCNAQYAVEMFGLKQRELFQSPNFCPGLVIRKLLKHLFNPNKDIRRVCRETLNKMRTRDGWGQGI